VQTQHLRDFLERYTSLHERYDFQLWKNTCPEVWIEELASAKMWLYTAPHGQRREEIWQISPEWLGEEEAVRKARGITWWTIVAIDKETARMAAFSDILFSPYRPQIAMRQDTSVDPMHRRRGLALYLKAYLILKLQSEACGVRVLTTTNVRNNAGILHINQKLGLVPTDQFGKWEGDVEQLVITLNRLFLLTRTHVSRGLLFHWYV